MKVLMICTEKLPVPPVLGGAIQTYIEGILPFLKKEHDITVLGVSDPSLPDEETLDGIHYVRVPGKVFEIYRESVVRYIEAHPFDLIHIFNRPRLVLSVRQAAPLAKITLSMHNDMFHPEKMDPQEAENVIQEVSNIVTVSDYVGNVISDLYPQAAAKVRTIYSGVDTNRFLPGHHPKMQKIRQEIRRANGLENKTVILFAGRLSRNKGVDQLVRALPELAKKFKDLALVIIGSRWFSQNDINDYIAYVRALAKRLPVPVVTTGFVAPDEIQNWFAAADLFVCTSQWQEPLARVHYEAMAAGLPIVTTARGGNSEVIVPRENGLVVENPEDPNEFVAQIAQIISDRSLMKKMGEKGRELAVSRYEWNRVASELLDVWTHAQQAEHEQTHQEYAVEPLQQPTAVELEEADLNQEESKTEQKNKRKEKGRKRKGTLQADRPAKQEQNSAGEHVSASEPKRKKTLEEKQPNSPAAANHKSLVLSSSSYELPVFPRRKGKGSNDKPFRAFIIGK
ncbi:glycosyl transferases group 1 family protein [Anoxybacillus sp. B7M1]|uniref:glycosyltransferase family 4 protein n=1 Tax=unclassified Anoxybacillus TaxID=2639704 RepID=UPI0007B5FFEF|nr:MULTISPECIES: glycosyltransferase family 4 protein [unclassified Anoxybacillus]ANB56140.1 glycosyl transferases group 1 family protein [Anoxybacillus sp. B2M1]ANB63974.1 glycosyl transferases group 1 family protein [Anoxybacillus sp. B7M1]